VGLTAYDVVSINQIIGFVGFQARVVAAFQAMLGHPVRWLPGHHIPPHALTEAVELADWQSILPTVALPDASAKQLETLSRWQIQPALRELAPVLCHEPALLEHTGEILLSGLHAVSSRPAVLTAIDLLSRSPDRFSAAQFTPLSEDGIGPAQAINLLAWSAFCGWLNRLKIALRKVE
jgi:hypothetical protein